MITKGFSYPTGRAYLRGGAGPERGGEPYKASYPLPPTPCSQDVGLLYSELISYVMMAVVATTKPPISPVCPSRRLLTPVSPE